MIQLSPPSPEVRAAAKMLGIAGVIIGVQVVLLTLSHFFTADQIITGIAMGMLGFALYLVFQMMVDQERHKDALRKLNSVAE